MATKLFLQNITSDISIDTVTNQASINPGQSQGAASGSTDATLVTNTQNNPGSPIQMTDTAGGSVVCFVSPPLAAAIANLGSGTVTLNIRGLESNASANAAIVVKITKYSGGTESTVIWNNTQTNVTELTTSDAVNGPSAAAGTSASLSAGDRVVIRLYITNANGVTMATGFTTTASYDGESSGAAGDSWIQFNENAVFRAGTAPGQESSFNTQAAQSGQTFAQGQEMVPTVPVVVGVGIDPAQP